MVPMTNRLFLLVVMAVALACGGESPGSNESSAATEPSVAESVEQDSTKSGTETPAIGQKAPDFTLTNHRGEEISLSDALGSPVVLAFYRGHW